MEINIELPEKLAFLFSDKYRYAVLYGGRGGAKSESVARVLLIKSLKNKIRILCTREIQTSIKASVHRQLKDLINELELQKYFDVTDISIKCNLTGSEFIFSGLNTSTATSLKSISNIDICWVEEAQVISDRSLELLLPSIRAHNSQIIFTFNPYLKNDPVYKMFIINKHLLNIDDPDEAVVVKINYNDNPFFPDVLRKEMERDKRTDYDKYLHIWEGECISYSDASVFGNKIVSTPFIPDTTLWDGPYFGLDFGFAVDPLVLTKCWIYERVLYIEYSKHMVGVEIDQTSAWLDEIPDAKNYIIRADNSRPEMISHLKRNGFPKCIACNKWKGSILDGCDHIRAYDKIVIHPRNIEALEQLSKYSYKTDRLTHDILPETEDANADTPDSIRYALEPLILGQKRRIPNRPDAPVLNSLGQPINRRSEITMARIQNPNLWIS